MRTLEEVRELDKSEKHWFKENLFLTKKRKIKRKMWMLLLKDAFVSGYNSGERNSVARSSSALKPTFPLAGNGKSRCLHTPASPKAQGSRAQGESVEHESEG